MTSKPINGLPGYLITDEGHVISIRYGKFRIMKPATINRRYLQHIFSINGRRSNKTTHRLVASAFIPNPQHKPAVNHIDGNKLNNSVTNLEWVTHSENMIHSYKIGLQKVLNAVPIVLFSKAGTMFEYASGCEASRCVGVDQGSISRVLNGKYKHAGGYTAALVNGE